MAIYDEYEIAQRLSDYIRDLAVMKNVTESPPRQVGIDHLPYVFFLPGRAQYSKRGADYWITERVWRSFLIASIATMDSEFEAANTAMELLPIIRRAWMKLERLTLSDGRVFSILPLGDGGVITDTRDNLTRTMIEFSLQVKHEEYVQNTGW